MNKFAVVKFGANLKSKVKSRIDSKVVQLETKPTIESKRLKEPATEATGKLAAGLAGQKRSSEEVDRTISQNSKDDCLEIVDGQEA